MMGFLCAQWRMIMMGSFTDDDDDDDDGWLWWWMIMIQLAGQRLKWCWIKLEWVSESGGGSNFFICRKLWCSSAAKFEIMKKIDSRVDGLGWTQVGVAASQYDHDFDTSTHDIIIQLMEDKWHTSACDIIINELDEWHNCLWQHHSTQQHHHRCVGWATQVLVTTSSSMSWMSDTSACDNIIIIHELDERHLWQYHHPLSVFWMYFWHELPLLKIA